ncbi:MAG: 50S ribosomal protein L11 methyltransferase [Proteobacteria bacterium]|nr:50S ribosomal protein L11 methyltransferase [Pseudomonadota bacterium]
MAELDALGTLGVEERAHGDGACLLAYFTRGQVERARLFALERTVTSLRCLGVEPVPETDWERESRRGLSPRCIGGLWVRPSWCAPVAEPELVIDPRQAFGSGEHASTRLALRLTLAELRPGDSLLDVGTGSGILGLAALRRGAGSALGVDVDPVACRNANQNRAGNALPLGLVCGTPDSLRPGWLWDMVVANLLWSELRPIFGRLRGHARRALIVSGLLASQAAELEHACAVSGWRCARELSEEQSGDVWVARSLYPRDRQSSRSSSSVSSRA